MSKKVSFEKWFQEQDKNKKGEKYSQSTINTYVYNLNVRFVKEGLSDVSIFLIEDLGQLKTLLEDVEEQGYKDDKYNIYHSLKKYIEFVEQQN